MLVSSPFATRSPCKPAIMQPPLHGKDSHQIRASRSKEVISFSFEFARVRGHLKRVTLNRCRPSHLAAMFFLRFLFKAAWWLVTLALLPTSTLIGSIFRRYMTTHLHWDPTPIDFSITDALRSEYTGLERLIDNSRSLISPLSRDMHLGSATMDRIITTLRSSSIGGADALARTFFQLSTDATDIGKKLQAYSASIDSTVDE